MRRRPKKGRNRVMKEKEEYHRPLLLGKCQRFSKRIRNVPSRAVNAGIAPRSL